MKKSSQWSKPTSDFWNDAILQNIDYARYLLGHKWNVGKAGVKAGLNPGKIIVHDWSKFKPKTFDIYEDFWFGPQGVRSGRVHPKVYRAFRKEVEKHYKTEPHHAHKLGLPQDLQTQLEAVVDWYSVGKTNASMKGKDFPNFVEWWNTRKLKLLARGAISKEVYIKIEKTLSKNYNIVTYTIDKLKELFK